MLLPGLVRGLWLTLGAEQSRHVARSLRRNTPNVDVFTTHFRAARESKWTFWQMLLFQSTRSKDLNLFTSLIFTPLQTENLVGLITQLQQDTACVGIYMLSQYSTNSLETELNLWATLLWNGRDGRDGQVLWNKRDGRIFWNKKRKTTSHESDHSYSFSMALFHRLEHCAVYRCPCALDASKTPLCPNLTFNQCFCGNQKRAWVMWRMRWPTKLKTRVWKAQHLIGWIIPLQFHLLTAIMTWVCKIVLKYKVDASTNSQQ